MNASLATQFLGWQCRIRQHAVRKQEGRPPAGSQASVIVNGTDAGKINTTINKQEPREVIAEFRFMVQKTNDARTTHENALKYLSEYYYQYPESFDDRLTALFSLESGLAQQMSMEKQCELVFSQGNQRYRLSCRTESFDHFSDLYQATYWHNKLFNANMPGVVNVVGFNVDWLHSSMD